MSAIVAYDGSDCVAYVLAYNESFASYPGCSLDSGACYVESAACLQPEALVPLLVRFRSHVREHYAAVTMHVAQGGDLHRFLKRIGACDLSNHPNWLGSSETYVFCRLEFQK